MAGVAVKEFVEAYCAIKLSPGETIKEIHIGSFPRFTNWGPIDDAPLITFVTTGEVLTEGVDFDWSESGQLLPSEYWQCVVGKWQLDYDAGYAFGLPAGLIEIIDRLQDQADSGQGNLESETLGDYSYKLNSNIFSSTDMVMLNMYRRMI